MHRNLLVCLLVLATACSGGDGAARDAGVDVALPDAPETAPTLTSFVPSPTNVTAGVPTEVTWNWTYLVDPPIPTPTCTIDNGVGEVTRGQKTMVTLTATTTFRLSCVNRVGMTARDTVITIPPAPPTLATFTATPSPLMPGVATPVTFNWTYSTTPSPAPTCTIDQDIGTATQGMQTSLTLTQARTYRLRCTSTSGTSFRDVTVPVDECTGNTHDCGANASCTDTVEGFTCACMNGYAGNGDVCSATNLTCTTPGTCDGNATCVGGTTCVCNTGYVGDGITCERLRLTFVTSATGSGDLSSWAGAVGTGLAAADSICTAAASNAGLPGTYVAWMSDANDDAYCRVHGQTGKKANNCGLGTLPVAAGPWVRTDSGRLPTAPTIDKLLAPTRQTFYPAMYDENGTLVSSTLYAWTGTDDNGVLTGAACSSWADGTSGVRGAQGDVGGGGTSWTDQGTDPTCNSSGRLRCVETTEGPSLPPRHPANAKRMFITSVTGNGQLASWPDAGTSTGITAATEICQSRARAAGYANAQYFEAWLSSSFSSATSRLTYSSGGFYRPDGIQVATSETDLTDGRINAPVYMTELNTYVAGNAETGSVWTGSYYYGSYTSYHCSSWSSSASTAITGRHDLTDFRWFSFGATSGSPSPQSCSATDYRLYCIEDRF